MKRAVAGRRGATVDGVAKIAVLVAIPVLFVVVTLAVAYRLRRPLQHWLVHGHEVGAVA